MAIHDEEAFPEGISAEEAYAWKRHSSWPASVGTPHQIRASHRARIPTCQKVDPPEAPPPTGHPEVPSQTE